MTSHSITIAKAAFAAACLRPDTVQLTREDVSRFHAAFETAVLNCTPSNVQTCKTWLVENVIRSAHRSTALGKYLLSFSKNIKPGPARPTQNGKDIPTVRQRLHMLYILNDVLHHAKYHTLGIGPKIQFAEGIESQITDLFQSTHIEGRKRVNRRLEDLLSLWENEQYFSSQPLLQVRRAFSGLNQDNRQSTTMTETSVAPKELPYILPATHGDPTIPYYDLPAANMMPHIVSNRPVPVRPDQVQALQLLAGPADEGLVNAVKDFLEDIERIEYPYQDLDDDNVVAAMDELGQISSRNEADDISGDTYYGWSREFCRKMRKRGQEGYGNGGRSTSYSRSRSVSRSRSRSRTRSLSRSPPKRRRYDESRSRSPPRHPRYQSRSASASPERKSVAFQQSQPLFTQATVNPVPPPGLLLGPTELPVPPPRPPNYNGPWPPPPPPLAPVGVRAKLPFPPSNLFPSPDIPHSFNPRGNGY